MGFCEQWISEIWRERGSLAAEGSSMLIVIVIDEPTVDDPEVSFRCLICMDKYCKPVISVKCWHVHCEECWLRTLGAKKLCPQCNVITSPADLRRIFL